MKLIVGLSFFILSLSARSQDLSSDFSAALKKYGIQNTAEQSFCYSQNGVTEGFRVDRPQRIASITKLFSTLMASETMNLNGVFTTKFHISGDRLHIEGGLDPYFEEEKLFLLFEALNQLGYRSFKQISFNDKFRFYDVALGEYEEITPEKIRSRLAYYTTLKNKKALSAKWAAIRKFAREEGVELSATAPTLSSSSVIISNTNPIVKDGSKILVHQSLPFHRILKSMNVQSKNFVAENVYQAASRHRTIEAILGQNQIEASTYKIYNGSGLPIIKGKVRLDNLSTCDTLLKVFSLLSESLRKHNLEVSDVVAVNGGKDLGSFRERFKAYPELDESIVSKTGTLKHTSTLGGFLLIGTEVPFAILNHTANTSTAKKFQDFFVARLFEHIGNPTAIPYDKISIFPWSDAPFFLP